MWCDLRWDGLKCDEVAHLDMSKEKQCITMKYHLILPAPYNAPIKPPLAAEPKAPMLHGFIAVPSGSGRAISGCSKSSIMVSTALPLSPADICNIILVYSQSDKLQKSLLKTLHESTTRNLVIQHVLYCRASLVSFGLKRPLSRLCDASLTYWL